MKLFIFLTVLLPLSLMAQIGTGPSVRQTNSSATGLTLQGTTLLPNGATIGAGGFAGNGPGLTNLAASRGIESLAHANVINVTNFGAVPYIPPNFGTGAFPTNAVDCSIALSNAFAFASNQPAPRVVYFPPGIYKFTNTLVVPPLTSIKGEGWLHQGGAGRTRVAQNSAQVATNNSSVLWYVQSNAINAQTNGTALRAPYTAFGPQFFDNFEVCGGTNAMADLGQGFSDSASFEMLNSTNLAGCGINFDGGGFCGGFSMRNVTVTGFSIGINHAGNFCFYDHCNFNGNAIGFVCTNNFAPDQVEIRMCSIGNRQGGLGYYIAGARGWIIEDPSDIDYHTWATFAGAEVTIIGGNSERNSSVNPTATLFQAAGSPPTYYLSNSWPYTKKTFMIVGKQGQLIRNTIKVIGGQWSGTAMDALVSSYRPINVQDSLTVIGSIWDTTNSFNTGGNSVVVPMLYLADVFQESSPTYIGSHLYPTALVQEYINGFGTAPKYTYTVGQSSMVPSTEFQLEIAKVYAGGLAAGATNRNLQRFGQLEHQFGTTTTPDWLQYMYATNWTSGGFPNIGLSRIAQSDPFPVPTNGLPNTNYTFNFVRLLGSTNTTTLDNSIAIDGGQLWVRSNGVWVLH